MKFHIMHHLWSQNLKDLKLVSLESEFELGTNEMYRNKTLYLENQKVRIVDSDFNQSEFNQDDIVVLTSNTKVLKGAMNIIASSSAPSSVKQKWKEHYSDAFVDLDEGFYSISLNKD